MPTRIQRKRSKGWRMPPGAIYIGRPSRWGNPFHTHGDGYRMDSALAVGLFADQLRSAGGFISARFGLTTLAMIKDGLRGKDLACWCTIISHGKYIHCHGDVLISIANNIPMEDVINENYRRAKGEALR